jgi:hypothetical protein
MLAAGREGLTNWLEKLGLHVKTRGLISLLQLRRPSRAADSELVVCLNHAHFPIPRRRLIQLLHWMMAPHGLSNKSRNVKNDEQTPLPEKNAKKN